MMDVEVTLPRPHRKQREIIASQAKRKIVLSGRRAGKSTVAAILAAIYFLKGRRVLYCAPVLDQTDGFWRNVKKYLENGIAAGIVVKNETRHTLEIPSGGYIRAETAFDADSLRGDHADLIVLDEFAYMSPYAWDSVVAPMTLDSDATVVFISTPNRKNHFYYMYQKALADETGRWATWHFTSYDNPYLSVVALEEITHDMTDDMLKQEVCAEFLEGSGTVFRNIDAVHVAKIYEIPGDPDQNEHKDHTIVAAIDWGRQNDFSVISVGCRNCRTELFMDRFRGSDYVFQRDRIKEVIKNYGVRYTLAEANAAGQAVIDMLTHENLEIFPFDTTGVSKPRVIENLQLAYERIEWKFLDDPAAKSEATMFEMTTSVRTGRRFYSAPNEVDAHDDTVMAHAIMIEAAEQAGPIVVFAV